MKNLISKLAVVGSISLLAASLGFAEGNIPASSKTWICSTNASSAPAGSAAENADKEMTKAKSADEAFKTAYENCRDCTKITCKAQQ